MPDEIGRLCSTPAFIAVDKPAGVKVYDWVSRGGDDQEQGGDLDVALVDRLKDWPEFADGSPVHLVHRLDRATSGVLLVARSPDAANELGIALKDAAKIYVALCRTTTPEFFSVNRPLRQRDSRVANKASSASRRAEKKLQESHKVQEAKTDFVRIATCCDGRCSLLLCLPRTGRQHQIRRHLDGMKCSISGDRD